MNLAIIIPTWKRQKKLQNCLESLEHQTAMPELVIITVRKEDLETLEYLENKTRNTPLPIKILYLTQPGVIFAENEAIRFVKLQPHIQIVTFMDDDAIAFNNGIAKIKNHFEKNPKIAALGGPDIILSEPETYHNILVDKVGVIRFFGKVIGHHHHKSQGIREVDVLKGVNMSIKMPYLNLINEKLQGTDPAKGNGVFWELDLCFKIKNLGGLIIFDPDLLIHHDSHHGHFLPNEVIQSTAHNLTLVMMTHLSFYRQVLFLIYSILVGNGHIRGLTKTLFDTLRDKNFAALKTHIYSMRGVLFGLQTWMR